jgi:hypothetical protein
MTRVLLRVGATSLTSLTPGHFLPICREKQVSDVLAGIAHIAHLRDARPTSLTSLSIAHPQTLYWSHKERCERCERCSSYQDGLAPGVGPDARLDMPQHDEREGG